MSGDLWESRAEKLRWQLAKSLAADGAVTSEAWKAAFAAVPRHVFVPRFYRQTPGEQPVVDESTPDAWLEGVYTNQLLVVSPDVKSSSTVPSLMAAMLEALDPQDDHRVLEIGTGTGYNAALLSHRVGDSNVVSVDIAADLINDAQARLASIGYRPTLGIGDGAEGWAGGALYDGIIATCAPNRIPDAWLDQTRPGGRIVTPIATGVAVVDIEPGRKGEGRFLQVAAFFMPLRPTPRPADLGTQIADIASAIASTRPTDLDEKIWFDDDFRFVLAAALPGIRFLSKLETGVTIFTHLDGSWARLDNGTVAQAGDQQIWNAVEAAHKRWDDLGRPTRDMFSISVKPESQHIRLEGHGVEWALPRVP
ncbi:methyltransferase domain-containing protein [Kribbella antibiotica]|uniref:Protein-L-isoaspartate O-methyltransferase n=1 Tax=Kribbella antibiotica TaxID=190195 RepID=A0A4R4ZEA7_9ACTN|nr:methyltransferase domain-containing protein [Kribbella antibiotica]TDD56841.1 methyltransferase domain-containing protein [Kribbella antibiotica]